MCSPSRGKGVSISWVGWGRFWGQPKEPSRKMCRETIFILRKGPWMEAKMNWVQSLESHGILWAPIRQPIDGSLLTLPPGVSQKPSTQLGVFGILITGP